MYEVVTPEKAGVQEENPCQHWIPAFAGMTEISYFIGPEQQAAARRRQGNLIPVIPGLTWTPALNGMATSAPRSLATAANQRAP